MHLKIIKNIKIDDLFALIGVLVSIILIMYVLFTNKIAYSFPIIFILFACVYWLTIGKRFYIKDINLIFYENKNVFLVSCIAFFVLLTILLMIMYIYPYGLYSRPLSYFLVFSIMVGLCSLQVLVSPSAKKNQIILSEILIIGSISIISQVFLYPSLIGSDPFWHQKTVEYLLSNGHVLGNNTYSQLPIFQILVTINSLLTSLSYKTSLLISISLSETLIVILFVFLLGKFIFNEKVGLFAALFLSISNYQIYTGILAIPTTLAVIFVIIISYLIIKDYLERSIKQTSLILFFMVLLILTHTITSVLLALMLFSFLVVNGFLNKFKGYRNNFTIVSTSMATIFAVGMLGWWVYASNSIANIAGLLKWGFSVDYFSVNKQVSIVMMNIPIQDQFISNFSLFLFFSLTFIGFFYMISKNNKWNISFPVAITFIIPLFLAFFTLFAHISLIQERWWFYSQILLSLPLAISVLYLTNFKSHYKKMSCIVLLTVFFSFIMFTSPIGSEDRSNVLSISGSVHGYTESEVVVVQFLSEHNLTRISTDYDYRDNYRYSSFKSSKPLDKFLATKNFDEVNRTIIIRKYIINNPFRLSGKSYRLNFDPNLILSEKENRIYENNLISVYT